MHIRYYLFIKNVNIFLFNLQKILCFVLIHAKAQDGNDFEEPPEGCVW